MPIGTGSDPNVAASGGATSGVVSVSGPVCGVVSVSGLAGVTGTVSVSGNVGVSGFVTLSGTVNVNAHTVNQGTASATAWPTVFVASHTAAQGATVYYNNVITNVVSNVKTSSGVVYGYRFYNPNQTVQAFVQFYKITAASVGLSTAVGPLFSVLIPSAGVVVRDYANPIGFASGIAIAATVSNSGSTANAIGIHGEINYQ